MPADTRALAQRAAPRARFIGILATLAVMSAPPIAAQDGVHPTKRALFNSIEWTEGEKQVDIGNLAEFTVPAGCQYADAEGARKFLVLTENPASGREQGVLFCRGNAVDSSAAGRPWFVLFTFDPSGYVRDDEKKLDADKILASIRAGTAQGNELRKSRGWDELTIDGWIRSPHYDPTTHNLTWSIRAHSGADDATVNHSVRLLGRRGVLNADLVAAPEQLESIGGTFDAVVGSTSFLSGHKYSEWRKGDKVAAYGLTALVVGGAGVAATKLGLFGKLAKYFAVVFAKLGKVIVGGVVALIAGLPAVFKRKKAATA
jgi:uncharacterized membrane-anchored protein